ncbi:hypothetical protein KK120_07840 [Virgibacillus dakarensis]|nr:hypothetical protein [Virgibacillus dakarensis]
MRDKSLISVSGLSVWDLYKKNADAFLWPDVGLEEIGCLADFNIFTACQFFAFLFLNKGASARLATYGLD